jgi:hypothetical protein
VAEDQVDYRILVFDNVSGIPAEGVVDGPSVVFPARDSTVAVVICLSAGPREALDFVSLRPVDEREVRIRIPAARIVSEAGVVKTASIQF